MQVFEVVYHLHLQLLIAMLNAGKEKAQVAHHPRILIFFEFFVNFRQQLSGIKDVLINAEQIPGF